MTVNVVLDLENTDWYFSTISNILWTKQLIGLASPSPPLLLPFFVKEGQTKSLMIHFKSGRFDHWFKRESDIVLKPDHSEGRQTETVRGQNVTGHRGYWVKNKKGVCVCVCVCLYVSACMSVWLVKMNPPPRITLTYLPLHGLPHPPRLFVGENSPDASKENPPLYRLHQHSLCPLQCNKSSKTIWHPHLISVPDIEWLSRGGYMSHDALVPLEPDAATGGLLQCGTLGYIEEAAHQELPVAAVLAHLWPPHTHTHTDTQQDVVTQQI